MVIIMLFSTIQVANFAGRDMLKKCLRLRLTSGFSGEVLQLT